MSSGENWYFLLLINQMLGPQSEALEAIIVLPAVYNFHVTFPFLFCYNLVLEIKDMNLASLAKFIRSHFRCTNKRQSKFWLSNIAFTFLTLFKDSFAAFRSIFPL